MPDPQKSYKSEPIDLSRLTKAKLGSMAYTQVTEGDLQGSIIQLIHLLVYLDIAEISDESYAQLRAIYATPPDKVTAAQVMAFKNIINNELVILDQNKFIRSLGDTVCEKPNKTKSNNDFYMLFLFHKILNKEILLSNHDFEFLNAWRKRDIFRRDWYKQTNWEEKHTEMAYTLRVGLANFLERKIVTQAEVDKLVIEGFLPSLKLISYSDEATTLKYFQHAPCQPMIAAKNLANHYKIPFDDSSKEKFCETLNQINIKFKQDLVSGKFYHEIGEQEQNFHKGKNRIKKEIEAIIKLNGALKKSQVQQIYADLQKLYDENPLYATIWRRVDEKIKIKLDNGDVLTLVCPTLPKSDNTAEFYWLNRPDLISIEIYVQPVKLPFPILAVVGHDKNTFLNGYSLDTNLGTVEKGHHRLDFSTGITPAFKPHQEEKQEEAPIKVKKLKLLRELSTLQNIREDEESSPDMAKTFMRFFRSLEVMPHKTYDVKIEAIKKLREKINDIPGPPFEPDEIAALTDGRTLDILKKYRDILPEQLKLAIPLVREEVLPKPAQIAAGARATK